MVCVPDEVRGKIGKGVEARDRSGRPRDHLGRPQPWGTPNTLVLEDHDALPLAENHRLGCEHFNAGRFFQAHEAWETAWKQTRQQTRNTVDVDFFKGLSQLGAAYVHLLRGNARGATWLLRRAASRLSEQPGVHLGIDARAVAAAAGADADRIERGELTPGENAAHRAPRV